MKFKFVCPDCGEQSSVEYERGETKCPECGIWNDNMRSFLNTYAETCSGYYPISTLLATVTEPNNHTYELVVSPIGEGEFAKCYLDRETGRVFSFVGERSKDQSKEIVSLLRYETDSEKIKALLPDIEMHGLCNVYCEFDEALDGTFHTFSMPKYYKVDATCTKAYHQAKFLCMSWEMYTDENASPYMLELCENYLQWLADNINDNWPISLAIIEALDLLICQAANWYGSDAFFDFHLDNFMCDNEGQLILLDVIYNAGRH